MTARKKTMPFAAIAVLYCSTLWLLAMGGHVRLAAAEINLRIKGDTRRVIDLGTFGFDNDGTVSLTVKDFALASNFLDKDMRVTPEDEPVGFVVDKVSSTTFARVESTYATKDALNQRICFIDDAQLMPKDGVDARKLFPFNGRSLNDIRSEKPITLPITVKGLYAIFFYNCRGFNTTAVGQRLPASSVTFDVSFQLKNFDANGRASYLSLGDQPLPYINAFFGLVFSIMGGAWWKIMQAQKTHVRVVHKLMLFLVAMKALSLFLDAIKQFHFATTGHASVWDVFYFIILAIKGIALFAAILLLGTGWSVLRSFLGEQDRKLLYFLLPAQVIITILVAVIEETSEGNRSWQLSKDILQVLNLACACCILLPLLWSMRNMQDAAGTDDKAALTLERMKAFRSMYGITLGFIYITFVIVPLLDSIVSFQFLWVSAMFRELIAACFYGFCGFRFSPHSQSLYSRVAVNDDEYEMSSRKEVV